MGHQWYGRDAITYGTLCDCFQHRLVSRSQKSPWSSSVLGHQVWVATRLVAVLLMMKCLLVNQYLCLSYFGAKRSTLYDALSRLCACQNKNMAAYRTDHPTEPIY